MAKRVFGRVRLTREEREVNRRIWEATKDEPSEEEFERRLGPMGKPFTSLEELDVARFRAALAHKIGVAREDAGLTRAGFAKLLGTDEEGVSRIETGQENMTVDTLAKIAKLLKLSVKIESTRKEKVG